MQRQTAVTAYFLSEELQLFVFAAGSNTGWRKSWPEGIQSSARLWSPLAYQTAGRTGLKPPASNKGRPIPLSKSAVSDRSTILFLPGFPSKGQQVSSAVVSVVCTSAKAKAVTKAVTNLICTKWLLLFAFAWRCCTIGHPLQSCTNLFPVCAMQDACLEAWPGDTGHYYIIKSVDCNKINSSLSSFNLLYLNYFYSAVQWTFILPESNSPV